MVRACQANCGHTWKALGRGVTNPTDNETQPRETQLASASKLSTHAEYLRCRTWGHAWEEFIPHGTRPHWGELFTLRCTRCTTERHDTINALGALGQRRYVYPEDYSLAKDETPTRDQFRLELAGVLQRDARARVNGRRKRTRVA